MEVIRAHQDKEGGPAVKQKLAAWIGFAGAPAAWFLQLETHYALIPIACATGRTWPLYAASVLFLLIALGAGYVAWTDYAHPWSRGTSDHTSAERTRFMGAVGLLTSGLFLFLILVQSVPLFVFGPCER